MDLDAARVELVDYGFGYYSGGEALGAASASGLHRGLAGVFDEGFTGGYVYGLPGGSNRFFRLTGHGIPSLLGISLLAAFASAGRGNHNEHDQCGKQTGAGHGGSLRVV